MDYADLERGFRPDLEAWLQKFGRFIVTIGLIAPRKGLEYLLKAHSIIVQQHPDVGLVVMGEEDLNDQGYLEKLKGIVRKLGLEDKVLFTGFLEDSYFVPVIERAAALVTCAIKKTQSGQLFREVTGCAVPVVASDVGGVGETVRQFDIGEVVPPADADGLARGILAVLTTPRKRYLSGIQKMRETEGWDKVASYYCNLYSEL